jgi:hypothetical protein
MIPIDELADSLVRTVVTAINAGDRPAFLAAFTTHPTLWDDGSERNFHDWIDREIFSSGGHMEVESQSDDGRSLIARYRNNTYGEMRTSWSFVIDSGKISRVQTGQA